MSGAKQQQICDELYPQHELLHLTPHALMNLPPQTSVPALHSPLTSTLHPPQIYPTSTPTSTPTSHPTSTLHPPLHLHYIHPYIQPYIHPHTYPTSTPTCTLHPPLHLPLHPPPHLPYTHPYIYLYIHIHIYPTPTPAPTLHPPPHLPLQPSPSTPAPYLTSRLPGIGARMAGTSWPTAMHPVSSLKEMAPVAFLISRKSVAGVE